MTILQKENQQNMVPCLIFPGCMINGTSAFAYMKLFFMLKVGTKYNNMILCGVENAFGGW